METQASPLPLPSARTAGGTGAGATRGNKYSRKVFVGGLPQDIEKSALRSTATAGTPHALILAHRTASRLSCAAETIESAFGRFGALVVDWPHKLEQATDRPPKGVLCAACIPRHV